jgi:hypothetical protein
MRFIIKAGIAVGGIVALGSVLGDRHQPVQPAAPLIAARAAEPDQNNIAACVRLLKNSGEMPSDANLPRGCARFVGLGMVFNPQPGVLKSAATELTNCGKLFGIMERANPSLGKLSDSCVMLAIASVHFPDMK